VTHTTLQSDGLRSAIFAEVLIDAIAIHSQISVASHCIKRHQIGIEMASEDSAIVDLSYRTRF
jgi:hypothetical protein